ncbi:hypothetical protein CDEN61S_01849 [Castellaniella denitrificans]
MARSTRPPSQARQAHAVRPQHARGVGLVQVEERPVPLRQGGQRRHVAAVAIHAEHAFGHDHAPSRLPGPRAQQGLEVIQVVVAEADLPDARRPAALVQAGMDQPVDVDLRVGAQRPRQRRQDRRIRLPSGGKQQRGLRALGACDPGLGRGAGRAGAADQPGGSRARPVAPDVAARPGDEFRMQGQPEVIVAAEVQDLAPAVVAAPRRRMAEDAHRAAQMPPLRHAQRVLEERIEQVPRHAAQPPD